MEKYQESINENKETYYDAETTKLDRGPFIGKRHIQATLLFLCVAIEFMSRSSLSLTIVAMTDNTTSINPNIPTYNWSDSSVVLSSFFWGYVVLQVAAGQLSKTYGAKWLLFGAMGFNSIATALIPQAAQLGGSKGVMVCRIVQGLAQGGIFPSCHTMLGRWAPDNERGRLSNFVFSGVTIGSIICSSVTGIICKSYLGWPASCYLFGGCGFAWCILWFFCGSNSPAVHSYISNEEKIYIEASLSQKDNQKVIPTPWKEIVTSIHCWACVIVTVGAGFGIIFLQSELPTYLNNVMQYDIASSGYLTSMTASVGLLLGYIYGPLSDFVVEKNYISRTNVRRIFAIYSCWGSAAAMLGLAYLDESQSHMSIFILTMSSVFNSAILFGHGVNPIDLSPRFSGIILGWANSTSSFVALSAPLAVQFIVSDETNATQWRTVFIIAAVMYVVPSLFFTVFVSGERQWWDDGTEMIEDNINNQFERKISKIDDNV